MDPDSSDKYRVRISRYCFLILVNDCQAFGCVNRKGEANLCGFLNRLIPVLVDQRESRQALIHDKLLETGLIKEAKNSYESAANNYLDTIFDRVYFADYLSGRLTEAIWIRPNQQTGLLFETIVGSIIKKSQIDLSKYLRSLIVEYCSVPQFRREQLFFKKEIHVIESAIEHGNSLMISENKAKKDVIPITMAAEYTFDQRNYLLALENREDGKILSLPIEKFTPLFESDPAVVPTQNQLDFVEELINDGAFWEKEEFEGKEDAARVLEQK
jgi:hypothetical protein